MPVALIHARPSTNSKISPSRCASYNAASRKKSRCAELSEPSRACAAIANATNASAAVTWSRWSRRTSSMILRRRTAELHSMSTSRPSDPRAVPAKTRLTSRSQMSVESFSEDVRPAALATPHYTCRRLWLQAAASASPRA